MADDEQGKKCWSSAIGTIDKTKVWRNVCRRLVFAIENELGDERFIQYTFKIGAWSGLKRTYRHPVTANWKELRNVEKVIPIIHIEYSVALTVNKKQTGVWGGRASVLLLWCIAGYWIHPIQGLHPHRPPSSDMRLMEPTCRTVVIDCGSIYVDGVYNNWVMQIDQFHFVPTWMCRIIWFWNKS